MQWKKQAKIYIRVRSLSNLQPCLHLIPNQMWLQRNANLCSKRMEKYLGYDLGVGGVYFILFCFLIDDKFRERIPRGLSD